MTWYAGVLRAVKHDWLASSRCISTDRSQWIWCNQLAQKWVKHPSHLQLGSWSVCLHLDTADLSERGRSRICHRGGPCHGHSASLCPFPSDKHHLSCDDWLEDERGD